MIVVAFGWYCTRTVPIDAIPNVGENQVIVLTSWPGRSPKDVEDQITYPLSVALLAVPQAESVRGKSLFGYSFVQVTFSDSTDFYWARSRVAEQLGTAASFLPDSVVPTLGPDATGLGQVFYYVLKPPAGMTLADVRSLQDFVVKYELQAVEGVSEVASIGGFVREYQVDVDPEAMRAHGVSLDVGARTLEINSVEYVVRGRGFVEGIEDLESTVIVRGRCCRGPLHGKPPFRDFSSEAKNRRDRAGGCSFVVQCPSPQGWPKRHMADVAYSNRSMITGT